MGVDEFIENKIIAIAIACGVSPADSYRVSAPLIAKFKRGQYKKVSDIFELAKIESKNIAKKKI